MALSFSHNFSCALIMRRSRLLCGCLLRLAASGPSSDSEEEEEHSPKTQQLVELAGRLAEERGIGEDQTVRCAAQSRAPATSH